jgi:hypothetical protein
LLDRRHVGNVTLVATSPKYPGNSWLHRAASNWTASTIFQTYSGAPLVPQIGSDQAYNGIGSGQGNITIPQRPDQVLPDVTATNRGQGCLPGPCVSWFNPAAVALPAAGTYGNMGLGSIRGPGFWEWDQTVSRKIQVTEGQQVEFRVEAFNVTNSVRLGTPNVSLSGGQFGRITSSAGGPRIMQFALKYIF